MTRLARATYIVERLDDMHVTPIDDGTGRSSVRVGQIVLVMTHEQACRLRAELALVPAGTPAMPLAEQEGGPSNERITEKTAPMLRDRAAARGTT